MLGFTLALSVASTSAPPTSPQTVAKSGDETMIWSSTTDRLTPWGMPVLCVWYAWMVVQFSSMTRIRQVCGDVVGTSNT